MTPENSFEGNVIAEFLVANQSVMTPLIDWGMTLVLLAIVLSPFLLIRLKRFQPVRWWHIIGAYVVSFFIFAIFTAIIFSAPYNLVIGVLPTYELLDVYDYAPLKVFAILLFLYPILTFYSTKLLYGSFTSRLFLANVLAALLFWYCLWKITGYLVAIGAGWALSQHF